jgi:hypothetical protein
MLFSEFLGTRHDCLLDPHMKISPLNAITAILTSRQIWIGLLLFKYRFTDLLVNVFLVVSAVTHPSVQPSKWVLSRGSNSERTTSPAAALHVGFALGALGTPFLTQLTQLIPGARQRRGEIIDDSLAPRTPVTP